MFQKTYCKFFPPFNSLNISQGTVPCQVRSQKSTCELVMWWGRGEGHKNNPVIGNKNYFNLALRAYNTILLLIRTLHLLHLLSVFVYIRKSILPESE